MKSQTPVPTEQEVELLERRPFIYFFRRYKGPLILGVIALLITNAFDAIVPLIIGQGIDHIVNGSETSDLVYTILILLVVTLALSIARFGWRVFWGRFHHSVADDLRQRIFARYTQLGSRFYSKRPVGELMTLITNDVNAFRMAIGPGNLILLDALMIFAIVPPLMISLSWSWTWKTLILMPLIPYFISKIHTLIEIRYRAQQDLFSQMSGVAQEIVSGVRVIKSYAQESNQTKWFNKSSARYENACNKVAQVDALFRTPLEFGVAAGAVILLLIGAPEVMAGKISVGEFFAFYQYIQRMIWPMTAIGISVTMNKEGKASFQRILALLKEKPEIVDEGHLELRNFEELEVRDLSFKYPGQAQEALQGISFKIKNGQTFGIIGQTGAGKSTLVDLLCRIHPVPKDKILINGQSIEQYKLESLRNTLSVVPQDPFLFSKKVSDNIAFAAGGKTDLDQVKKVAGLVNIEEEIENIDGGFDAYLGERGVNLSGGQKQRLTIARALLKRAPLTFLDDSLSAVDTKTESKILRNLKEMPNSTSSNNARTTVVVSHRLNSVIDADQILVLNEGRMEALGTHTELLEKSPTYRSIYDLQNEGARL